MDKEVFFQLFRASVSSERLDAYRQRGAAGGDENLVLHYAWNIHLCEALYPVIQCVEVALRNSLHAAGTKAFIRADWYDTPGLLERRERTILQNAKGYLLSEGKTLDPPRVVAELSFGFWTGMLNSVYHNKFWVKIARDAFPYLPTRNLKRRDVLKHFNNIRLLRNRVFHHEPIWHWRDLKAQHDQIIEVIGWINPAMQKFTEASDRFAEVYQTGMTKFKQELERKLPLF